MICVELLERQTRQKAESLHCTQVQRVFLLMTSDSKTFCGIVDFRNVYDASITFLMTMITSLITHNNNTSTFIQTWPAHLFSCRIGIVCTSWSGMLSSRGGWFESSGSTGASFRRCLHHHRFFFPCLCCGYSGLKGSR